jgi:hypothetical protein
MFRFLFYGKQIIVPLNDKAGFLLSVNHLYFSYAQVFVPTQLSMSFLWQSKVIDSDDPSLPHFFAVFKYC